MSAGNVVATRNPGPASPPDVASPHRAVASLPLLAVLAGLGAASMNLVLSSLPQLQEVFGVDYHTTQNLLTAFLAGAALGQLGAGPLADAYDRRTMLCLALGVFIAGSATAALAPTLAVLIAGRFLQGLGGAACLVIAEAIVARGSTGVTLARRIGLLNAGMAIAIMLAPLAGAAVAAVLGWRGLFWLPAVAGLALLMCASRLPRAAATRDAAAPIHLLDGMGRLLRSRRFVTGTLAAGFVMANYFCLAAFGPYIAMTIHGLDGVEYSFLFAAFGLSYIAGNIASGKLYARYGERRVVVAALVAGLMVGAFGLLLALIGAPDKNAFLAVGVIIATSTGLTLPAATSRSLSAEADSAGAAAGLFNFAIFGIGGLVTHIVGDHLDKAATMAMAALPLVTLISLLTVFVGYGRNADS